MSNLPSLIKRGPKGSEQGIPIFENQLLSYIQAARYLSISEPYLRRLKQQGQIPFVLIGLRGVRFKLSSLNSWVEKREIK